MQITRPRVASSDVTSVSDPSHANLGFVCAAHADMWAPETQTHRRASDRQRVKLGGGRRGRECRAGPRLNADRNAQIMMTFNVFITYF